MDKNVDKFGNKIVTELIKPMCNARDFLALLIALVNGVQIKMDKTMDNLVTKLSPR